MTLKCCDKKLSYHALKLRHEMNIRMYTPLIKQLFLLRIVYISGISENGVYLIRRRCPLILSKLLPHHVIRKKTTILQNDVGIDSNVVFPGLFLLVFIPFRFLNDDVLFKDIPVFLYYQVAFQSRHVFHGIKLAALPGKNPSKHDHREGKTKPLFPRFFTS